VTAERPGPPEPDPPEPGGPAPSALDTSVPHPARVYDYWLGGKDNYAPVPGTQGASPAPGARAVSAGSVPAPAGR
jgi:hypothetical protein